MKARVNVFIEKGGDGSYGAYVDLNDNTLNYGLLGEGATVEETKADFLASYEEMKESFELDGKPFQEAEFNFVMDIPSFLEYYSGIFTKSALERMTGINQTQFTHYASGFRRPSKKTIEKLDTALQRLAEDLKQVRLT